MTATDQPGVGHHLGYDLAGQRHHRGRRLRLLKLLLGSSGVGHHPGYTDRDYFRFATTNLEKRNGQAATVYLVQFAITEEGNSANCTSELSDIYSTTGGISSSTAWGGPQGSKIASASSNAGGGSSCPAANVDFSSSASGNSALKTTLQSVATAGASTVTLELRADSETNEFQYKLYKDNPSLTVYYNFAPLTPTALSVQNQVTCDLRPPTPR